MRPYGDASAEDVTRLVVPNLHRGDLTHTNPSSGRVTNYAIQMTTPPVIALSDASLLQAPEAH